MTTNGNKRYKISSAVKSLLNKDTKFKGEVRDLLKSDEGFRDSVKGKNGESPPVDAIAQKLITNKANELGQAVLEAKDDKGKEILYLKVVRLGSGFGDSDYKLTFCKVLGNEFFEYKKYDPEYSRVPDEWEC